jgi:hypothetical protein
VDGHEFPYPESNLAGDGKYAPFRVFDITAQDYVGEQHPTRDDAEAAMRELEGRNNG